MKTMTKYSIIAVLSFIWVSCSTDEMPEVQQKDNKVSFVTQGDSLCSRNIDYSIYEKLETRKVMPRDGQFYRGSVSVDDLSFPLYIFWDLSYFEDYNLYAYVEGSCRDIRGIVYCAAHVATYKSACNSSIFNLIIQCNIYRGGDTSPQHKHVSFHVTFFPQEGRCGSEVLEYGSGMWPPIP